MKKYASKTSNNQELVAEEFSSSGGSCEGSISKFSGSVPQGNPKISAWSQRA